MEAPCLSKGFVFQRHFVESSFMYKIRYVNHYTQQTKQGQKNRDNVRRDQLGQIPDVPVQAESMETCKHSPEHSRAPPLTVK